MIAPLMQLVWEGFAERIVPQVDASFAPIGERLVERYDDLLREAAASASTMVHGDYRLENLLLGESGTRD